MNAAKVFVFSVLFCLNFESYSSTNPESLERYDLESLCVVRTVMYSDAYRQKVAIVIDFDGYVHVAIKGSYIGKNKGVVVGIYKNKIVVRELNKDGGEIFIVVPVEPVGSRECRLRSKK